MATTAPIFSGGGLASGLDTNAIIDAMVKAEQLPITLLKSQQTAFQARISVLGSLSASLDAFSSAAASLNSGGLLALSSQTTAAAFSITPTAGGTAGRYQVQVGSLASAAQARSAAFNSAFDSVTGGTLSLNVKGTTTNVTITDGMTLTDLAAAINSSGAAVSAHLLNTGTQTYLSLTNTDTGFPLSGVPGDALSITETSTGTLGKALGLGIIKSATNAQVTVDGLSMVRQSNTMTDVIPGATLSLRAISAAPEDVVLSYDVTATQAKLQGFVDAYNKVLSAVQKQLDVAPGTDREASLAGDSVARSLQQALQRITSTIVPGVGSVRSLADLGITTARDGSLSITGSTLAAAISRQPSAIDQLFSKATTGVSAIVAALDKQFTDPMHGVLTQRSQGLSKSIEDITARTDAMQQRIDIFRANLVAQFTAMETVVSGLKSIGSFLSNSSAFTPINGGK